MSKDEIVYIATLLLGMPLAFLAFLFIIPIFGIPIALILGGRMGLAIYAGLWLFLFIASEVADYRQQYRQPRQPETGQGR